MAVSKKPQVKQTDASVDNGHREKAAIENATIANEIVGKWFCNGYALRTIGEYDAKKDKVSICHPNGRTILWENPKAVSNVLKDPILCWFPVDKNIITKDEIADERLTLEHFREVRSKSTDKEKLKESGWMVSGPEKEWLCKRPAEMSDYQYQNLKETYLDRVLSGNGDVLIFNPGHQPRLPDFDIRYGTPSDWYLVSISKNEGLEFLVRSANDNVLHLRVNEENFKKIVGDNARIITDALTTAKKEDISFALIPYEPREYIDLLLTSPMVEKAVENVSNGKLYGVVDIPLSNGNDLHFSANRVLNIVDGDSFNYNLSERKYVIEENGSSHYENTDYVDIKSKYSLSFDELRDLLYSAPVEEEFRNALKNKDNREEKEVIQQKAVPAFPEDKDLSYAGLMEKKIFNLLGEGFIRDHDKFYSEKVKSRNLKNGFFSDKMETLDYPNQYDIILTLSPKNKVPQDIVMITGFEVRDGHLKLTGVTVDGDYTSTVENVVDNNRINNKDWDVLYNKAKSIQRYNYGNEIFDLGSALAEIDNYLEYADGFEGHLKTGDYKKTLASMRELVKDIPDVILPEWSRDQKLFKKVDMNFIDGIEKEVEKQMEFIVRRDYNYILNHANNLPVELTSDGRAIIRHENGNVSEHLYDNNDGLLSQGSNFKVRIGDENHELQILHRKNNLESVAMLDKNPDHLITVDGKSLLDMAVNYSVSTDRSVENRIKDEVSQGRFFVQITNPRHQENWNESYSKDIQSRIITDYEFLVAKENHAPVLRSTERDFNEKFVNGVKEAEEETMQYGVNNFEGIKSQRESYQKELSSMVANYHSNGDLSALQDIPTVLGKIEKTYRMQHELRQYVSGLISKEQLSFTYDKYKIPKEAGIKAVQLRKDNKGRWLLSVSTQQGTTLPVELKKGDIYAFEHLKICTKEQLAAKYFEKTYNYAIENRQDKSRSLKVW